MLKRFISKYKPLIFLSVVLTGLFASVAFETYQSSIDANRKKETSQLGIKIDESAPIKVTQPVQMQPEAPAAAPSTTPAPTTGQQTIGTGCTKENIVKYSITFEERDYIPRGEQKVGIKGYDGFTSVCKLLNGQETSRSVYPVTNELIYVGTGQTPAEKAAAEEVLRQQDLEAAQWKEATRLATCIRNMSVQYHIDTQQAEAMCRL